MSTHDSTAIFWVDLAVLMGLMDMEFLGAIGILILLAALIPAPTATATPQPATPPTTTATPTPESTPESTPKPVPESIIDQGDDREEQAENDGENDVTTEQPPDEIIKQSGLSNEEIFDRAHSEGITSYNGLNQYLKGATGVGASKSTIKKWKLSRGLINDAS